MNRHVTAQSESRTLRCAIYTRKSSEEGLGQDFNSLDAQREACAAYILSQRHEGWVALADLYDDGGFSGGSMERPALRRLLAAIAAGGIDIVVVYKVDRLTRALADFAKIVEIFDASGVSFVSVTQSFNTTSSMGRLTLNVLLSFAQFEREVTAERIRDKIAASKKKGMWMGGNPLLGYDVADRRLVVNEAEATTVRHIFSRYLALGSVQALKEELDAKGITSKRRRNRHGQPTGGASFSRGALYALLQNPLLIGEVAHKGQRYPGAHAAIIPRDLWDRVQALLAANRHNGTQVRGAAEESFLTGLLHGPDGRPMTATHSMKRLAGGNRSSRKRYRYYLGAPPGDGPCAMPRLRIPAPDLESAALSLLALALGDAVLLAPALQAALPSASGLPWVLEAFAATARAIRQEAETGDDGAAVPGPRQLLLTIVARIDLATDNMAMTLRAEALLDHAGIAPPSPANAEDGYPAVLDPIVITRPFRSPANGRPARLLLGNDDRAKPRPDPALIALVANARRWAGMLLDEPGLMIDDITRRESLGKGVVSRFLPLAFLAPGIVEAILDGRQPPGLTVGALRRLGELPREWAEQRRLLGFEAAG